MSIRMALGAIAGCGLLGGSLLLAPPATAQPKDQGAGMKAQAVPSMKQAPKEQTGKVAPFTVGAVRNPGPAATGTAQASPSQLPAPKATPEAIDSHQGKFGNAGKATGSTSNH